MDLTKLDRVRASLVCGALMLLLSVPCILGFNVWSGFEPLGEGTSIFNLEDFIVSTLLLPIGSLIFVLFCTTKRGWGLDAFIKEANEGKGLKIANRMRIYIKYALPVIMLAFSVLSIVTFFIDK